MMTGWFMEPDWENVRYLLILGGYALYLWF